MHDRHGRRSQRIRHVIGPLVSAPEIAQVQIAPGPQTGPHFLEADLSRHTVRLEILIQFSTSPARSGIRRQHAARGSEIPAESTAKASRVSIIPRRPLRPRHHRTAGR
jgi:hypothetical protein